MNTPPNLPYKFQVRAFYRRLLTYAIIMLFLLFINSIRYNGYWWVIWPAAGWGISLLLQSVNLLFPLHKDQEEKI